VVTTYTYKSVRSAVLVFSNLYGELGFAEQQSAALYDPASQSMRHQLLRLWRLLIRTIRYTRRDLRFQFCAAIGFCRAREGRATRSSSCLL